MNAASRLEESVIGSIATQRAKVLLSGYFSDSGTSGLEALNASDRDARLLVGRSPVDRDRIRVTADEALSAVALVATFVILMWLLREVGGFVFA